MALTSDEFRRRVLAAAALHGTGMRGVRKLLEDFGTEKTLAEAVIRGDKDQNKRNLRDISEALEVPRAWFTEPDWRKLVAGSAPDEAQSAALQVDQEEQGLQQEEDAALPGGPIAPPNAEPEPGTATK